MALKGESSISIHQSVFDIFNDAVKLFNRKVTLVFADKVERCGNCITNTIGGRSIHVYRTNGPIPFGRGMQCPLCGGAGNKRTAQTEDFSMRVYHRQRDFLAVPNFEVNVPSNYIQTIFYLDDMPDVMKAKEILIDIGKYDSGRYKRATEPFVQGFKQNNTQYGVCFWEQV